MPAVTAGRTASRSRRTRSSPAALRVNVTAIVCPGSIDPVAACHAIRRVRTRVLPAPAPPARPVARRGENGAPLVAVEADENRVGVHPWTVPTGYDGDGDGLPPNRKGPE